MLLATSRTARVSASVADEMLGKGATAPEEAAFPEERQRVHKEDALVVVEWLQSRSGHERLSELK
jgi:hypothetical protein